MFIIEMVNCFMFYMYLLALILSGRFIIRYYYISEINHDTSTPAG